MRIVVSSDSLKNTPISEKLHYKNGVGALAPGGPCCLGALGKCLHPHPKIASAATAEPASRLVVPADEFTYKYLRGGPFRPVSPDVKRHSLPLQACAGRPLRPVPEVGNFIL